MQQAPDQIVLSGIFELMCAVQIHFKGDFVRHMNIFDRNTI